MSHPIHQKKKKENKKGKSTHQLMALPAEDNIIRDTRTYPGKGFHFFLFLGGLGRTSSPSNGAEWGFIRAGITIKNVAREKLSIFYQRVGLSHPLGKTSTQGI